MLITICNLFWFSSVDSHLWIWKDVSIQGSSENFRNQAWKCEMLSPSMTAMIDRLAGFQVTFNCMIHFSLCSFGLWVPKLYFYLNLKWHWLYLKGISDPLNPLSLIFNFFMLFLYVCPKVVFLDKPKISFFAFKIRTGEYILCSFGFCVPKLYFHLNLKWHCLRLKGISDPLKTS